MEDIAAEPPINCEEVDVQAMEDMAYKVGGLVTDYVMNVDLSSAQFDTEHLFEEAQKLGLDIDDLREYGFDTRAMKCTPSTCNDKEFMKELDERINGRKRTAEVALRKGAEIYKKAMCHPWMK